MSEAYENWSRRNDIMQEAWDRAAPQSSGGSGGSGGLGGLGSPTYGPGSFGGSGAGYSGGGSLLGSLAGLVVGSATLVVALVAWPVLYCVPLAIAFLAAGLSNGMLEAMIDPANRSGIMAVNIGTAVVALIVLVVLSRLDHRAARSKGWWIPRHVIRLGVIATVAHLVAVASLRSLTQLEGQVIPGIDLLRDPRYLAGLAIVLVLAHVVLTRRSIRAWWHGIMEHVKLRAA